MGKIIDLNLNAPKENQLYHEIHEGHTHFYYEMWELEKSPVLHPAEYKEEWIKLSVTYNSKGETTKVEVEEY